MEFLQNFRLETNSFWVGFLAASLFWWLVRISPPLFKRLQQNFRTQAESAQWDARTVVDVRLRNETLRYAQSMHLAAPLFSLDEILIQPGLLASGLPPDIRNNLAGLDISETLIPDTPDWPQIASFYQWPVLTLAEALGGGANLAIIGQPGAGKSVALAHLASQLARQEIEISGMDSGIPLYIHAADLALPSTSPDALDAPLLQALGNYLSQQTYTKLPAFIDRSLQDGHVVLILDGMDELQPAGFDLVADYLEDLLTAHPQLRIVTAVSSDYWGKLPQMGFHILPLANWNHQQRTQLLENWSNLWKQHFPNHKDGIPQPDADLIKGWFISVSANLTPLELVCKTWAAFAGDSLGSQALDAIESFLRRKLYSLSEKERKALEHIAGQMLLTQQPIVEKATLERWLGGQDEFSQLLEEDTQESPGIEHQNKASGSTSQRVKSSPAINAFIACGILRSHPQERYSINHPVWAGYLAARSLDAQIVFQTLDAQKNWDTKKLAMQFLACVSDGSGWITNRLQKSRDSLLPRFLLQAGRWLPYASKEVGWNQMVLREMANELHNPANTENLKARLLAALIGSDNNGVSVLLRQLLRTPEQETRKLAILGLGMLRDTKAVEDLVKLLSVEEDMQIAKATILSLVAIGNQTALESVANMLLHGNEQLRRAAAEAFANHSEEGHPTLKEASNMEDPGIRRAAVFGLARIHQPWADEIVESLRTQDTQWVVQDAANQAMALRGEDNPRIPVSLPPLSQSAWLIEFAAQRGLGVAPGEPAVQLLYTALEEGNLNEKMAALYTLGRQSGIARLPALEKSCQSPETEIRQAAVETIWRLQASGLELSC
jgi:HEAT repeat protein